MINAVSLLNDIKQPEFIQTDRDYAGDRFAFSSMLQNAVSNEESYARQAEEVRDPAVQHDIHTEDVRDTDRDELSAIDEDTEIELTVEECAQSLVGQNVLAMLGQTDKSKHGRTDFGDRNKYTAAIAGLNTFVKKNIEITDGRKSAAGLLDNQPKTAKIKVRDLDVKSRSQVIAVLQQIKSGRISESAGMQSIAAIAAQSPAVMNSAKIKSGKNVKVSAKIVSNTGKIESNNNLFIPQTRMSQTAKTEKNNTITKTETIQNKSTETAHTEVNRRYDKTKKAKAPELQGNSIQNANQTDVKELVTELTLKSDSIHDAENAKADVKTVLSENKDAVFNKMVENTKIIQGQNMTKFSMVMRPENVGRMDFHLTVKDGKLSGRIILQNSEAADFFRANIEEITAVFRKANVELGKLDVSLAGQQFHSEAQTFAGQSNGGGQGYSRETLETVRAVSQVTGRAVSAYESHATPAAINSIGNNRVNLLI